MVRGREAWGAIVHEVAKSQQDWAANTFFSFGGCRTALNFRAEGSLFELQCWGCGNSVSHWCVIGDMAILRDTHVLSSGKRGSQKRRFPVVFNRAASISTVRGGNTSGAGQLFLLTFPLKAKGYSSEWCSGAGFAHSFGQMKSATPILERVYEILDYFHYRRGKSKWFNFSLEWRPREVWSRLSVRIVVVVHNLLLPLLHVVDWSQLFLLW